MRKQTRLSIPLPLIERGESWTSSWLEKRRIYREKLAANDKARAPVLEWPTYRGVKINITLVHLLAEQTEGLCSFCETLMEEGSENTVEHFFPKSNARYEHLVFSWGNLFICCTHCQSWSKRGQHHEILKPDDEDYDFNLYFLCEFSTGILRSPMIAASGRSIDRTRATLKYYGLNEGKRPFARMQELENWKRCPKSDRNILNFRFRSYILAWEEEMRAAQ